MRFVEVGPRLEYAWHGPGPEEAPTLVFLHEGLGCAALWRDFPQRLAEATGCGALVYSREGYGASDPVSVPRPLSYMHHEAQVVLPKLLDALQVREALLVGHSDGGSIALIAAGANGDGRLRALVLEAAHVFCEDVSVASITAAKVAYETGDLRAKLSRHHHDVDGAFWGWNRAWLDPQFRQWNLEEFLPGVTVPVLALQGAQDPYGTLKQLDAIERGCRGPVQRVVLADCQHTPHREQEAATLKAMATFIADVRRR